MPRTKPNFYRALPETDEIRLLKLARTSNGIVSGVLESWSLKDAPEFHALSYAWGAPKKDARVLINGHELKVTRSLEIALTELSRADSKVHSLASEYVWVDQICINQKNDGEKRHQVTLMGPIYSKAIRTIVWLGEDSRDIATSAFDFCRQLEQTFLKERIFNVDGHEYIPGGWFNYAKFSEYSLPTFDDERWAHLNTLLTRPWFTRLWVQQEAILSRQDPLLIFGASSCSITTLSRAYHWLSAHDFIYYAPQLDGSRTEIINRLHLTMQLRKRGVNKDLSAMVVQTSDTTHSTDPRDKLYGILGIAEVGLQLNEETGTRIRVDYLETCTPAQAYRNAARHIILSTRTLAILSGPKLKTRHVRDPYRSLGRQGKWRPAPSWVPSWDRPFHPGTPFVKETFNGRPGEHPKLVTLDWMQGCWASKGLPVDIEHSSLLPDVLRLRGLRVDQAHNLQEISTKHATGFQYLSPREYMTSEGTIRQECAYFRNVFSFYGLHFSRYLLQSLSAGRRRPPMLRLWETALKTTNRTPEDLAAAVLTVATGGGGFDGQPLTYQDLRHFGAYLHHHSLHGELRRCRLSTERLAEAKRFMATFTDVKSYDFGSRTCSLQDKGKQMDHFNVDIEAATLQRCSEDWTNVRRLFMTKEGRLGVGPAAMKHGDEICVLFGGGAPFVLRRIEADGTAAWAMVGEAWIEGYMGGEAVDAWKEGKIEAEWFDIH